MRKISPNLIGFIIALLVCIASLWVYFQYIQKESFHLIDNPTEATLNIKIDDNEYVVAPMQQVEVHLELGKHQITATTDVDAVQLLKTEFEVKNSRGLINPTLSRYYIFGMPYGPKVNKDSIFRNLKTMFKGKVYLGDLQIDSLVYTEDFYYNLNENYPKMTLKSENENLRKKVFREDEFKQFYFEHYE